MLWMFSRGYLDLARSIHTADHEIVLAGLHVTPEKCGPVVVRREAYRAADVLSHFLRRAAQGRNTVQRSPRDLIIVVDNVIDPGTISRKSEAAVDRIGLRKNADTVGDRDLAHPEAEFTSFVECIGHVLAVGRDGRGGGVARDRYFGKLRRAEESGAGFVECEPICSDSARQ